MFTGAIINSIVGLIGLITIIALMSMALIKKKKKKLRQAGLVFVGTLIILVGINLIEFLIVVSMT